MCVMSSQMVNSQTAKNIRRPIISDWANVTYISLTIYSNVNIRMIKKSIYLCTKNHRTGVKNNRPLHDLNPGRLHGSPASYRLHHTDPLCNRSLVQVYSLLVWIWSRFLWKRRRVGTNPFSLVVRSNSLTTYMRPIKIRWYHTWRSPCKINVSADWHYFVSPYARFTRVSGCAFQYLLFRV